MTLLHFLISAVRGSSPQGRVELAYVNMRRGCWEEDSHEKQSSRFVVERTIRCAIAPQSHRCCLFSPQFPQEAVARSLCLLVDESCPTYSRIDELPGVPGNAWEVN